MIARVWGHMSERNVPNRIPVLGVGVSTTSYDEVASLCRAWSRGRTKAAPPQEDPPRARYICVTSVHGIVTAFRNAEFRDILNQADVVTPDGMPVVWALRSFGAKRQKRVYGPTLMLELCRQAAREGQRVFLYGGRAESIGQLIANLKILCPGLIVAGSYAPPFRPLTAAEDADCVEMIRCAAPQLLFVGIGAPKQEHWMAEHCPVLRGVVMIGVGAAFDFHAGCSRQAPQWMQKTGLEWFFRLCSEPARLWKRYILQTPLFLPLWAMQKLGILKYREKSVAAGSY